VICNYLSNFAKKIGGGILFVTIRPDTFRFWVQLHRHSQIKILIIMKNWKKMLAFAFMATLFLLEACHRGSGCPGSDF